MFDVKSILSFLRDYELDRQSVQFLHDELARLISGFEEVESVTLMSGGYDLGITLTGSGLRDIAGFVSQRLATLSGVLSTRTHFVLKRYKEKGILIQDEPGDERGVYL